MQKIIFLLLAVVSVSVAPLYEAFAGSPLRDQVDTYKLRYGLRNTDSKLVDNRGNGYEALYGVRNFRTVLHGSYYRGGANNRYHRDHRRSNSNPLPNDGLKNLCEEGFTDAVYLYSTNFSTAPKSVTCKMRNGERNELRYSQISSLSGTSSEYALLKMIRSHATGERPGPVYAHCWNGWHASGYIAALSLKQFCGYSGDQALNYWTRNTDSHSSGMTSIKRRIRDFKPIKELAIPKATADLICP